MGREKYFRFDLSDLLEEHDVGDNQATLSATIVNKMKTQSYKEAIDYLDKVKEANDLSDKAVKDLQRLMKRYSKWR